MLFHDLVYFLDGLLSMSEAKFADPRIIFYVRSTGELDSLPLKKRSGRFGN